MRFFLFISFLLTVFVPRVYGDDNIAQYRYTTTGSSYYGIDGGNGGYGAVDGDVNTLWNAGDFGRSDNHYWLTVDLGKLYSINRIVLVSDDYPDFSTEHFEYYNLYAGTQESALTGTFAWDCLTSGVLYDDPILRYNIYDFSAAPVVTQYLKFEVTGGTDWAHLNELRAYATPEPVAGILFLLGGTVLAMKRRSTKSIRR